MTAPYVSTMGGTSPQRRPRVPDREAIIEAMAEAYYHATWGPMPSWENAGEYDKGIVRAGMAAAYDASPIERYRKALEEIVSGYYESAPYVVTARRALRGDD